uniref:Uncharacterized protein n=1 Tax=Arundo donax TaxID=35708 RepID=A0A0A9DP98_ARUDO
MAFQKEMTVAGTNQEVQTSYSTAQDTTRSTGSTRTYALLAHYTALLNELN